MPSQNGNGGRRGPWDSEVKPGSVIEYRVRQGQDRLNQILQSGGPRRAIVLAVLALVGLIGKYLKDVPPGLHFKLPLGV